ncbi:MAG: 50S ribosomal protein L27 [Candidatus Omnitrophica bacterium]|nr:50S ribosomal protein L27 [Candidatus Omnitrophota bacterium]
MARKGGITNKYYKETRGLKASGGQEVPAGTVLTRQGDRWKPGLNIIGRTHLVAGCEGEVYFTHKKDRYKKASTYINIRPKASKS